MAATAGVLAACGSGDPDDDTVLEPGPASGSEEGVDLVGTTWNLDQVSASSGDTTTPNEDAFVTFTEDGRVEANSGCNGYGGDVEIEGDQVTFGTVMGTLRACEGATGAVDQAFSTMLNGTVTASVSDGALTLTNSSGASLEFTAAEG